MASASFAGTSRSSSKTRRTADAVECRGLHADGRSLLSRDEFPARTLQSGSKRQCSDGNAQMTREPSTAAPSEDNGGPSDRLDSWKDVAAYLRRDVSTVQRWERREGLPIRRHVHAKQGSVYAFRSELDSWQHTRTQRAPAEETDRSAASVAEQLGPDLNNGSPSPVPSAQRPAATPAHGARPTLSRRRLDWARRRGHRVRCRAGPSDAFCTARHHIARRAPAREPLR
jgi:hypothetical protein